MDPIWDWWKNSGIHQLIWKYPIIYRVLNIPGGCLGFLPSTVCFPPPPVKTCKLQIVMHICDHEPRDRLRWEVEWVDVLKKGPRTNKPQGNPEWYWWWKKSQTTTWDVENPVNNRINYISTGDRRISSINRNILLDTTDGFRFRGSWHVVGWWKKHPESLFNWVVFHPLYAANNQGFGHSEVNKEQVCSNSTNHPTPHQIVSHTRLSSFPWTQTS